MKADHFHAPSLCFQWDLPPPVTGKHVLHRQHSWVLLLPMHPGVQSTLFGTNPHAQETPKQPLHTSRRLLTGSLTAWWWLSPPRRGWQGTDLLAVLEPASLLKHQGDDVLAAIPGPNFLSHPPQHFLKEPPDRAEGGKGEGRRDAASAFTWCHGNSRVPAPMGIPWGHRA